MLMLFCRLCGVYRKSVSAEADWWLAKLGLHRSGKVQCMKYSGGMKRRLSAGMALIGYPSVILFDEPTTGVDPVSRRLFWEILSSSRKSGQSVILTSHSMEECEAVCSRMCIMVNGSMQCIGSAEHIKNKFAQGDSLTIKVNSKLDTDSRPISHLIQQVQENFSPCELKDQNQSILLFHLSNTDMPWNELFSRMEDLRISSMGVIGDYSITETTLEQVFLAMAGQSTVSPAASSNWVLQSVSLVSGAFIEPHISLLVTLDHEVV